MDVRTKMLVSFQDFEGLTEVFAPGSPPGYPRPQDIPATKLTLWAAFSFLTDVTGFDAILSTGFFHYFLQI